MTSPISEASAQLSDTAPLVRRAVSLDPRSLVRVRLGADSVTSFVRLPFNVLVGRTVKVHWDGDEIDCVVSARELLAWLDGATDRPPASWDALWRGPIPPGGEIGRAHV